MTLTPHIPDPPAKNSPEAVIHLARLAREIVRRSPSPILLNLASVAEDINRALPKDTRVVPTDRRCDAPFPEASIPELENAAALAIVTYTVSPDQAALESKRISAYLMIERYFVWCRAMGREADRRAKLDEADTGDPLETRQYMTGAFLGHWFASLCPVIEGWESLGLTDVDVDRLMSQGASTGVRDRLFRFRNGVFHFQRTPDDKRFAEFMDSEGAARVWALSLERALEKYFRRNLEAKYAPLQSWVTGGRVA